MESAKANICVLQTRYKNRVLFNQVALWTWVGLGLCGTIACLQGRAPFYDLLFFERGPKFTQWKEGCSRTGTGPGCRVGCRSEPRHPRQAVCPRARSAAALAAVPRLQGSASTLVCRSRVTSSVCRCSGEWDLRRGVGIGDRSSLGAHPGAGGLTPGAPGRPAPCPVPAHRPQLLLAVLPVVAFLFVFSGRELSGPRAWLSLLFAQCLGCQGCKYS